MILYEMFFKLMNGSIKIQTYLDGSQQVIYEYIVCGIRFIFESFMKG